MEIANWNYELAGCPKESLQVAVQDLIVEHLMVI